MNSYRHISFPQSISSWKRGPCLGLAFSLGRGRPWSANQDLMTVLIGVCGVDLILESLLMKNPQTLSPHSVWAQQDVPLSPEGRASRRKAFTMEGFLVVGAGY